jgi:HK97 family phage portal protein
MNPFQRIADRLVNWWRGEPRDSGGVVSLNSQSFLERLGLKKKRPTSEVTYFTCLKMLSETLAKMPIKYYQKTDRGIIEAEQTGTSKLLTKRPNPFMTPTVFWNTVEMNRCHYGNGYVYMRKEFIRKKYGGEFRIVDMWVMQSNCVQIIVDDAGIFAGVGRLWYVYTDPTSGRQYIFSTDDVMHFKTSFSFDGITGLPVQQILKDTVSGASSSQDYMNKLYESGLTAKATLEYTGKLNEEAKKELVRSFESFGSGAKNTGKILPVPQGMKLTPLDIKLTDAQFFELKKYTALQIAAAFGVKPNQINNYDKSSYNNSEMQQLSFYVDTELFVIKQYEEEINYKILTEEEQNDGLYYKYNEKVLFRTDSKTQMDYLKNGVAGSIMTANEARRKLDLPDSDGGNVLLANGNIVPLTQAGAAYRQNSQTQEKQEEQTEPDEVDPDKTDEPDDEKDKDTAGGGEE